MKRIWVSLVAAGLLAIAAIAPAAAQDTITLEFEEVDDSGVSGNVRISSEDGEAQVEILLTSGVEEEAVHPVHIHEGSCDDLGDVVYPLEDIEDGSSETTIDVDLADLRTGDYAVNAHLSEDEIGVFIACADIPASVGGEMDEEEDEDAEDEDAAEDEDEGAEDEDATDDDEAVEDEGDAEEDEDAAEDDEAADEEEDGAEDDDAAEDEDDAADEDGDEEEDVVEEADDEDEEDEVMDEDDEDEEADAVAPATGSSGGVSSDSAAMMLMLLAGTGLGAGVLIRRRVTQVQRS